MKLTLIKAYFGLSSFIAPKRTGERSFKLFQKVRIKDIRRREEEFFEKAEKFTVPTEKEPIDCFELGNPDGKLIFLVHGWESNAGSMSLLAFRFADLGYRVIAFNLPGHAFHKSSSTNLLECKLAMQALVKFIAPKQPFSVVAHSFGSAVVANALSNTDYTVERLVFLTNPNKIEDIFTEFKEIIGLSEKAYRALMQRTTKMLDAPLSSLDVDTNLVQINFEQLLLIHDANDRILPYSNSEAIDAKLPNARLVTLQKVGHYRMLWAEEVVDTAVAFVEGEEIS